MTSRRNHIDMDSSPPPSPQDLPYAAPSRESRRGPAVTALVCGILGLFCPLVGLIGVVLGIVVLVQAARTPHIERGRGFAIAGLCTGMLGMLLMAVFLLPSLARARELSKRVVCQTNMRGAHAAILLYADDYDVFPPNLDILVKNYPISPNSLICPSAAGPAPHIEYVTGLTPDCTKKQIILYEDLTNHLGEGGNVVYCDGTTVFVAAAKWTETLTAGGIKVEEP